MEIEIVHIIVLLDLTYRDDVGEIDWMIRTFQIYFNHFLPIEQVEITV